MSAAVGAGLAGGVLGLLIVLMASPTELMGRVPRVSGLLSAPSARVAVVDGQTLVLNDMSVRLDGIVAPARGQACRRADGSGGDCGAEAVAALAALVRDRDVSCRLNGRDREGFPRGVCEVAGLELNRAQVAAGWARAEQPGLSSAEAAARAAGRGLWREPAL